MTDELLKKRLVKRQELQQLLPCSDRYYFLLAIYYPKHADKMAASTALPMTSVTDALTVSERKGWNPYTIVAKNILGNCMFQGRW